MLACRVLMKGGIYVHVILVRSAGLLESMHSVLTKRPGGGGGETSDIISWALASVYVAGRLLILFSYFCSGRYVGLIEYYLFGMCVCCCLPNEPIFSSTCVLPSTMAVLLAVCSLFNLPPASPRVRDKNSLLDYVPDLLMCASSNTYSSHIHKYILPWRMRVINLPDLMLQTILLIRLTITNN